MDYRTKNPLLTKGIPLYLSFAAGGPERVTEEAYNELPAEQRAFFRIRHKGANYDAAIDKYRAQLPRKVRQRGEIDLVTMKNLQYKATADALVVECDNLSWEGQPVSGGDIDTLARIFYFDSELHDIVLEVAEEVHNFQQAAEDQAGKSAPGSISPPNSEI